MGRFEIKSRKPSTFEVAVNRVVSQTSAVELISRAAHHLPRSPSRFVERRTVCVPSHLIGTKYGAWNAWRANEPLVKIQPMKEPPIIK
jgi:hypothetical protein